uniref:Uncharacterized protein n=1 Tax=Timema douglasi TaxID=61478 RepID=A0A7R8ZA82_TIMDO|nr:unnamed protein product [Timema douglasi]
MEEVTRRRPFWSGQCHPTRRGACATVSSLAFVIAIILVAFLAFGEEDDTESKKFVTLMSPVTIQLEESKKFVTLYTPVTIQFEESKKFVTLMSPVTIQLEESKKCVTLMSPVTIQFEESKKFERIKGKMSMFELGNLFRQRYQGFLSRLYSPKEMHMESSANDRCLMSAELVLAGLYPPIGSQVWNHDLNWQPIPVHSTPRLQDKKCVKDLLLLMRLTARGLIRGQSGFSTQMKVHMDPWQLPGKKSLSLVVLRTSSSTPYDPLSIPHPSNVEDIAQVNLDNAELYSYLTEKTGKDIDSILEVEYLYNTLEIEERNGLPLPEWTKTVYPGKMKYLASLSLALFSHNDIMRRLNGGPVFILTANFI